MIIGGGNKEGESRFRVALLIRVNLFVWERCRKGRVRLRDSDCNQTLM